MRAGPVAFLLALVASGDALAAAERRELAVVVTSPTLAGAPLEEIRGRLSSQHDLYEDPAGRAVLERFLRARSYEGDAREALSAARTRLRAFDLDGVEQSLRTAQSAAQRLPPTPAGQAVLIEVLVRQAELALLKGDERGQRTAMARALSIAPSLDLAPADYPPTLRELLAKTRATIAASAPVTLEVLSTPPGATVIWAGAPKGSTPLTLQRVPSAPQVLWLHHDGFEPQAVFVEPSARSENRVTPSLEALPVSERVRPLVESLRTTRGEERKSVARVLATALDVDGLAVIEAAALPPVIYWRSGEVTVQREDVATTASAGAAVARAEGPVRWPALAAAAGAVALAGAGAIMGSMAASDALEADQAHFASDGAQKSARAQERAVVANTLFGAAGASAIVGVVLWFTFD